jgi:(4S)-4-hydroxy-5-phosphonooxypentane-2,3-dione isomerase
MSGFVVLVDFRLKPGSQSGFRKLVDANATDSVRNEPGCRRFDVLEVQAQSDRVLLYEIYDNEAAFDEHCRTRHFLDFDKASAALVAEKIVSRCNLVLEPRPGKDK